MRRVSRHLFLRSVSLVLFVTAIGHLILASPGRAEEPPPASATARLGPSVRRSDLPAFGVSAPVHAGTSVDVDYARAQQVGARAVSMTILWEHIEPVRTDPPTYHWGVIDHYIATANSHGIEPFIVMHGGVPSWAYTGDYKVLNSAGRAGLAQFAAAGAARYRGMARLWSFFNEPDCNGKTAPPWANHFNSCYGDYGAEYAKAMREVYPAMKAVNPDVVVSLGGIAYERFAVTEAFSREFVDEFLEAGGGDYIDLLNFHYFVEFDENWAPYGPSVAGKTAHLRSVMASHGVAKPIIVTEIGKAGIFGGDEAQADSLMQSLARGFGSGNDMVFWYELADPPLDPSYEAGLINSKGIFKPAATAYLLLSQKLAGLTSYGCPETSFEGVEAYSFRSPAQSRWEMVAWSRDSVTRTIQLSADEVVRTTRARQVTTLRDATDGRADGVVSVSIGPSPVVLDVTPITTTVPVGVRPFKVYLPTVMRQTGAC